MKDINIKFIPQSEQRYQTIGDYWETDSSIEVRITKLSKPVFSMAALIHELWELFRAKEAQIPFALIDVFDMNYDYENGKYKEDVGLDPEAPYHKQHMESDALERTCLVIAGEDFIEYDNEVGKLFED